MDSSETRRRVKAARALAGISVGELAERIGQPGLGERTLRSLEGDGGRAFRPMELQAIAQACDLPADFFRMDFTEAAELWHDSIHGDLVHVDDIPNVDRDAFRDDPSEAVIEAQLGQALDERIRRVVESLLTPDATREAMTATRAATQSLKGRAVAAPSEPEVAAGTHAEADATRESGRSRREAKP